ncbi:MAG: FtsX-like permease family protein [Bdellovibrionia bacterium]
MSNRSVSAVGLLARRFLLSKSSDGFLSLIAWVSVVGVALGVLALVVVTSVINGFEGELARVITGMNGDVVLYTRTDPLRDVDAIERRIRDVVPETQAITDLFVTELMAAGPSGVAGAILEGLDMRTVNLVTEESKHLTEGRMPSAPNEVALGSFIADRLGLHPGGTVRLIIPTLNEEGREGEVEAPRAAEMNVTGVIRMGLYEYDSKFVYGTLEGVQKLLNYPDRVTSFKIKLTPGSNSTRVAERLGDQFGYPFRAKNWAMLNKNLLYAISLEKAVIAIILTVIIIVAAFNVVSTLMMMIHDKTKEIAILKAMGFKPSQSFGLFCMIGVGMGIVGTFFGVAIAMGVNTILAKTHLIRLPADIYYISFLPVIVRWKEVGMIALVAISISFLATLYPGWKVARRSPLDGLRYE